jgi:hypothetical protein
MPVYDAAGVTPYVHILRPRGHYIGQVRRSGHRLWKTITGPRRSARHALAAAVLKGKGMKRARVLFIDSSPWYDPHVVMEARLS